MKGIDTVQTSTLRPGLLVSLKTSVVGNVRYDKRVIESAHLVEGKAQKAKWETERLIADVDEHEAALTARSKARSLIGSVCAKSAFGLLCPEARAEDLDKMIAEARIVAEAFNASAKLTRVSVYVITGRIAPDDVEAVKAIKSEVRELLDDMKEGVENLDVKRIRDAADRARSVGTMLAPEVQARVSLAIDAARAAAKKIVKAGEQAAAEVDLYAVRTITESRTAFLDMDEAAEVKAPAAEGRAVDFEPDAPRNKAADGYQPEARELEV